MMKTYRVIDLNLYNELMEIYQQKYKEAHTDIVTQHSGEGEGQEQTGSVTHVHVGTQTEQSGKPQSAPTEPTEPAKKQP